MGTIIHAPIVQSSFSGDHCLEGNAITRGAIILESNSPRGHLSGDPFASGASVRGSNYAGDNCPRTITISSIRHRRFYRKNTYLYAIIRNSRRRWSVRKGVLRNFAKFTAKHLCQSIYFNKVSGLRFATLLKQRLWHMCFRMNLARFLRVPFL